MTGRKGKYIPELIDQIRQLLEDGNTDQDTCALVGIHIDTFYTWIVEKDEFSELVTRARGIARQRAVDAYRAAMKETQQTTDSVEAFSETRLDRDGKPYTYTKTTKKKAITKLAPDWRAAESYLKRRDPDNWAETLNIRLSKEEADEWQELELGSPHEAFRRIIENARRVKQQQNGKT